MTRTRRQILLEIARLGLAGMALFGWSGCSESDACFDPESWTTGEASLRASLHFAARSPHGEAKQCSGCEFFRPKADDGHACGDCQILQGAVNAKSHCDSWSAKA